MSALHQDGAHTLHVCGEENVFSIYDVDSAVGLRTKATVAPGESVTMTFCHGFTTDFSAGKVPASFNCSRLTASSKSDVSVEPEEAGRTARANTIWNRVRRFFLSKD